MSESLEQSYPEARRLMLNAESLLERLETDAELDRGEVSRAINAFSRYVLEMEPWIVRVAPDRRAYWRGRVRVMSRRAEGMRAELTQQFEREHRKQQERERDQLIGNRVGRVNVREVRMRVLNNGFLC